MENAARWFFTLAVTALLLYAFSVFRTSRVRLGEARDRLTALQTTAQALREENEILSRDLAAAGMGSD